MNRLGLFLMLRRQNSLALRRSPAFEQSVIARVMLVLGAGVMVIYLIFIGVMFAMIANSSREPAVLLAFMPLWMVIDFGLRFMVQQTPSMMVKPYLLQPIPRSSVIETFLFNSLLAGYNWTWLAMFLPYALIIFCGGFSLLEVLGVVLSGMALVMLNSLFYLMVRTLVNRSLLWWVVPIVVYGLFWLTLIVGEDMFDKQMELIFDVCETWWFPVVCIALLVLMLMLNRWMQMRFVAEEIGKEEKGGGAMKHVSQLTFLERYGQTGEYLKLEVKSIMRNKAIRARVMMSLGLIVMLTLLIAYTDIYNGRLMLSFWCFYCFGIYGITTLIKIMGPEGNYIDLLLTHRENILSLLKAKYYFHVAILLVPLVLMLPAVIAGKFSILMMIAYMLVSSGLLYCVLFQLAVYNKQTLPLNQKITGKNSIENGMQLVIELIAMFLPMALVIVLLFLFDETTAYLIMSAIGLAFTLAHPWWLRNVYNRMMKRKYENLEGFHASR